MNRWQIFLDQCRDSDSDSDSSIGLIKEVPHVKATNSEFLMNLEESAKSETTCRFPECEKVLSDPDIKCEHCDWGYCDEHALPEMHGCDEVIKFELEHNGEIVESEDYDSDRRYSFNEKLFDFLCRHRLNVSDEEQSQQSADLPAEEVDVSGEPSIASKEDESVQTEEQESDVSEDEDSIVSEEGQSVKSEENQSVMSEENQSLMSEENQSLMSEENQSLMSEENQSLMSEENQSIMSEENQSIMSEENQSLMSEENQSIMSEENQSVMSEEECEAIANKLSAKLKQMHFKRKAKPGSVKAKT